MDAYIDWRVPYCKDQLRQMLNRKDKQGRVRVVGLEDIIKLQPAPQAAIIEGPENHWHAWAFTASAPRAAFAWPSVCSDESTLLNKKTQQRRVQVCYGCDQDPVEFKVPPITDSSIDSGFAAVFNALWLLDSRKKQHPGGCAYLDLRKEEYLNKMAEYGHV